MMKVVSIALALLLAVCMVAPLLFISRSEIEVFHSWFEQLGMESQSLMFAVLRLVSYPYFRDLQEALLIVHGVVGSALVVTIGEVLGSGAQLAIFDTIIAPLVGLRGKPQVEFIASALRGMPTAYSALLQLTVAPVVCTFWPVMMLGLIGDSDLIINFAIGTILGQIINLELKIAVMYTPAAWASEFLAGALVPALRSIISILLTYWLWQEARAVAAGGGNFPEEIVTNPAADVPTDVDAPDDPEADSLEALLAGVATAPAGQRAKQAVASAINAAAQTVRRTGRSAKARVLRFHEAAPSVQDTLKRWTPPQLRTRRGESEADRDDSAEPGTRSKRRSTAATPRKSISAAVKKEPAQGLSIATRSRGRSHISAPMATEEDSMMTGGSVGASRRSIRKCHGPNRDTVEHRLETTLTDNVYSTPGRTARSRKLSVISPATTAE